MSTKIDGGLAFPSTRTEWVDMVDSPGKKAVETTHHGLTVLQWYAGKALQGMLADPTFVEEPDTAAVKAFNYAEAMIREEIKRYGGV